MDTGVSERSIPQHVKRIEAAALMQRAREYRVSSDPQENLANYFNSVVGVSLDEIPLSTDIPKGFNPNDLEHANPDYKAEEKTPVYQLAITVHDTEFEAGDLEKFVFFRRGSGSTLAADFFLKNPDTKQWEKTGGNSDSSHMDFTYGLTTVPRKFQWPKQKRQ